MAFTEKSKAGQQAELKSLRQQSDAMKAAGLTKAAERLDKTIARREAKAK